MEHPAARRAEVARMRERREVNLRRNWGMGDEDVVGGRNGAFWDWSGWVG